MAEAVAALFIFIAVMSISLLLFTGWAAVITVKGVIRAMTLLIGLTIHIPQRRCPDCRQANPRSARFCRRCGHPLSHGFLSEFLNLQ